MFLLAFVDVPPPNSTDYQMFLSVLGALGKLVVLSMFLERALAFVFENPWYVYLAEQAKAKGHNDAWIKAVLALAGSFVICNVYGFDVVAILFNKTLTAAAPTPFGVFLTALIAAGGSAGAISLFQGFLNISKDSRDAVIAANKADAERLKTEAERLTAEAEAAKQKTMAEAATATQRAEAESEKVKAELGAAKQRAIAETEIARLHVERVKAEATAAKQKAELDAEKQQAEYAAEIAKTELERKQTEAAAAKITVAP